MAKLVATGAALAVTAYSRALGKQLLHADGVAVEGAPPNPPGPLARPGRAQQQLDTVEVILHAEQVQFTTQDVPVERVRLVRHVVTAAQITTNRSTPSRST